MNDFERRYLDIVQNSSYLAQYARTGKNILAIDYFAYNTSITGLQNPASGLNIGTSTVQIQSDSDFVLTYLSAGTIIAGSTSTNPIGATLQITDTGTGKTFFNAPTLMSLVCGQGGYPFLLPSPRLLAPNTNIKFDVTQLLTAAVSTDFYISMLGARLYYS